MLEDLDKSDDRMSLSEGEAQNSDEERKSDNESEKDNKDEKTGRKIDPKTSTKRIIRNPQPKLNAQRLKGPKGVHTIEKYFEGFKYYGKGHENKDLDRIMKRLEHWAHRLFPKYRFDDFLEKVEAVGSKKELTTFLTKYRKDMDLGDGGMATVDDDDNDNDDNVARGNSPEPIDEFDLLIAEQIEKTKQATNTQTQAIRQHNDEIFDNLFNSENQQLNQTVNSSQIVTSEITVHEEDTLSTMNSTNKKNVEKSEEEIKKRIEKNRQLAIERRLARLKRDEEKKKKEAELQETSQFSESSQTTSVEFHEAVISSNEQVIDIPNVPDNQMLIDQQEIRQEASVIEGKNTDDQGDSTIDHSLIFINEENHDKNEKNYNSKLPSGEELEK